MRIQFSRLVTSAIFSAAVACWCAQSQASMLNYFETVYDTDWTTAAMGGMRSDGTGTINLAGVSGSVTKAYLYWHGPTNSADPTANATVSFAGNTVVGTNIGFSDNNFWGFANSQAYRADVMSLVTGNGNYLLDNFNNAVAEINGVSLVVYYDDGNTANNRDVVTYDGNDANFANPFDGVGWTATLSNINYSGGTANLVLGVADGQDFSILDDPRVFINGSPLYPVGDQFDGTAAQDAGGSSFPGNGLLWDVQKYDATSFLSLGLNSLLLTTGPSPSDALSLIHLQFDLPAGAAPPPSVPEPSSIALIGLGAMGFLTSRFRRSKHKVK